MGVPRVSCRIHRCRFRSRPQEQQQCEFTFCILKGFWRRCSACTEALEHNFDKDVVSDVRQCQACKRDRAQRFSASLIQTCTSCELAENLKIQACATCGNLHSTRDLYLKHEGSPPSYVCGTCEPTRREIRCDACFKILPRTSFSRAQLHNSMNTRT